MNIEFQGFDWDLGNVEKNLRKHAVSCMEVEEVFQRKNYVFLDERHSTELEKRYVLFGETSKGRDLFVVFTMRGVKVRIISARPMSRKERNWYEKAKG